MRIDLHRLRFARTTTLLGVCVLILVACSDDRTGASLTGIRSMANPDAPSLDAGGSWTTLAPMPVAQTGWAVGVIAGQLYATAGGPAGTDPKLQVYDPASNSWSFRASMPTNRSGTGGEVIHGEFYVVGGAFNSDARIGVTNVLEVYDPATNTWTTKAPMPQARAEMATGVIDGKLYVAGGYVACGPCLATNTLQIYDPVTNSWTIGPPMPVPASHTNGEVINGKFYVAGGLQITTPGGPLVVLATLQVYDPATNAWTTKAPMPTARYALGVGELNGILYAVGGDVAAGFLNVVEAYDPATDTWSAVAPMSLALSRSKLRGINGVLYVPGGYAPPTVLATLQAFTPAAPADVTPPTFGSLPAITASAASAAGVVVSYTATASDNVGVASQSCTPTSGSMFPIGTTTVQCTASDAAGNTANASFAVTVVDVAPPIFGSLPDITANATSAAGVAVSYAASASDNVGVASQSCTPATGSLFPIGTTSVQCSASDAAGNTATASFTVTVKGAAAQMTDLRGAVEDFDFQQGTETSLLAKLNAAFDSLAAGSTTAACGTLNAMINQIDAQTGTKISATAAATLINDINRIRGAIGC